MQNGWPMNLLRFLLFMVILLSPLILITVVSKIEDFVEPQRIENRDVWKKTLHSEQTRDAKNVCEIYIDNKTQWDKCVAEVLRKKLMINNYKYKSD